MFKKLSFSFFILLVFSCKKENDMFELKPIKGDIRIESTLKELPFIIQCDTIIVNRCPKDAACFVPDFVSIRTKFIKNDSTIKQFYAICGDSVKDTAQIFGKTVIFKDISPNPLKNRDEKLPERIQVLLKVE